jgi:hypothetical protein
MRGGSDGPVLCDDDVTGPSDEELHAEQLAGHGWELTGLVIGGLMLAGGLLSLSVLVRFHRR